MKISQMQNYLAQVQEMNGDIEIMFEDDFEREHHTLDEEYFSMSEKDGEKHLVVCHPFA